MSPHDPTGRSRGEQAADWIGWHLTELLAVGVPAVLAVTVAVWLIGLSVLAGAVWAAAEIRGSRTTRPALDTAPPAPRPALTARPTPTEADPSELYGDPS